jgi:HSP20 family protein
MRMYDPFGELEARHRETEALRRELERVFGGSQPGQQQAGKQASFLPGHAARAYPRVNVAEDADNITIEALAPGVDPEKLEITVVRNTLTIAGEKSAPEGVDREAYHRSERSAGRFVRTIELSTEVDPDKVQARYTNGLLVITLPKAEAAKPRQIQVSVS